VRAAWVGATLIVAAVGAASSGTGYTYAAGYTVETATIMVKGTSMKVLTDENGMTLYYVRSDTLTTSSCADGCAKIWPPLLSGSAPTAEESLPGKLSIVKTANGSQVSYNGHLLYRYSGDSAPHQASGQGIAAKWSVAVVDLKPLAAGAPGQPAPKSSSPGW
jgi:predicted lipoprotein with Yx(FWY)xxD motif